MNLSRLVDRFATGTYVVTRAAAATSYTDGVRAAPSTTTLSVVGAVQPIPGKDLERLPEGIRDSDVRYIWTKVALRCGPDTEPDQVAIEGASWQVEEVRDWSLSGTYFRSIVRKA